MSWSPLYTSACQTLDRLIGEARGEFQTRSPAELAQGTKERILGGQEFAGVRSFGATSRDSCLHADPCTGQNLAVQV